MKSISKFAVAAVAVVLLAGCSGTTYNEAKDCSMDYLLVPALSVPAIIGACDK